MSEQLPVESLRQLKIGEAAAVLNLCVASVYNLMNKGEIRSTGRGKLRRIPVFEIERWQRNQIELNELERKNKVLN